MPDTTGGRAVDWQVRDLVFEIYLLKLYIAGLTPKSVRAINNLRRICESHLKGRYRLEIIDLLQQPALARTDQILAVPTLVKNLPPPIGRIIGDLSDTEQVLIGLNIQPVGADSQ